MQVGRIICVLLFTAFAGWCGSPGGSDPEPTRSRPLPPVLRNQDPQADVIVRLPGPAPAPLVESATAKPAVAPTLSPDDPPRPLLRRIYPPRFEQDSASFCQEVIGQWMVQDARFLLGEPLRQRPAYDDGGARSGTIYAFSDPTNRYKELELDFSGTDGTLRTVFVYPFHLTWQEARRRWGEQVSATDANNGRRFYSYVDRRLDVLVDHAGKVISFGLY